MMWLLQVILLITAIRLGQVDSIHVKVNDARIVGFKKEVLNNKLGVFLGIPYAQPPTGDNRFRKPRPVKLTGKIDATKWPKPCWQPDGGQFVNLENKNFTDDCLYLNIWAPKSKKLKPVLVWIFGGGLSRGASNDLTYEGDVLAALGNVVVVSMNYRLNVYGFLFADSEEIPGNVGFYDQLLAIEWVHKNIKYFCGDPKKVTLIGQSAGGWSVSAHFLSPLTRNLFKNGIALSGTLQAPPDLPVVDRKTAINRSLEMAKNVGCAKQSAVSFNDKIIECLKTVDPSKFYVDPENFYFFCVIYNDDFLPQHPLDMLNSVNFKHNSQLMIGNVENEGFYPVVDETLLNKPRFTKQEAKKVLRDNPSLQPYDISKIIKTYISPIPNDDGDALRKNVTMAVGDANILCTTIQFARMVYENDRSSRVFEYYYTYKHSLKILKELKLSFTDLCQPYKGACHTFDLVSLFGWPFKRLDKFSDQERELSKRMIETVASFSRFGRPTKINGIEWPEFSTVNDQTEMPYYEFARKDFPRGIFGRNLKQYQCRVLFKT